MGEPSVVEAPAAAEKERSDFLSPVVELLSIEGLGVETKARIVQGLSEAQQVLKKWSAAVDAKPQPKPFGGMKGEAGDQGEDPSPSMRIYDRLVAHLVRERNLSHQGEEANLVREEVGIQLISRPDFRTGAELRAEDPGQRAEIDRIVETLSTEGYNTATELGVPPEGFVDQLDNYATHLYNRLRQRYGVSANFNGGSSSPMVREAVTGSVPLTNDLAVTADIWQYNTSPGSISYYYKAGDPGLSLKIGSREIEKLASAPSIIDDLKSRNIPGLDEVLTAQQRLGTPDAESMNTRAPFELL